MQKNDARQQVACWVGWLVVWQRQLVLEKVQLSDESINTVVKTSTSFSMPRMIESVFLFNQFLYHATSGQVPHALSSALINSNIDIQVTTNQAIGIVTALVSLLPTQNHHLLQKTLPINQQTLPVQYALQFQLLQTLPVKKVVILGTG